jgi:Lrp/AsnC family transcriptional regulator, leucine-responsive regulatory protein
MNSYLEKGANVLPQPFDQIDLRILQELQKDARLTNLELSSRVSLSPSPCLVRVRALEQAGIVERHVTLLNARAVGLGVSVFINVSLERQVEPALETFESATLKMNEVMECYLMTGDADYLLRVVVADVQQLEYFIINKLSRIPGVSNIRSSFALKQVKYKTELPLEDTARPIKAKRKGARPRR